MQPGSNENDLGKNAGMPKPSKYTELELYKKIEVFRSIEKVLRYRLPPLPIVVIFILIANYIFRPYPTSTIAYAMLLSLNLLILPFFYIIKKMWDSLNYKEIYMIMAIEFTLEIFIISAIIYFWTPLIVSYTGGGIIFIMGIILIQWITSSNTIFDSKKYSYFIFFVICLSLIVFGGFEYYGLYPDYENYQVRHLYHTNSVMAVAFPLFIVLVVFGIIQFRLELFWRLFRKQSTKLRELNKGLDAKVSDRTKQLEEAKAELEKKVMERTRELDIKVGELERFRKLSVGRELKMIELKKKVKELESELMEQKYTVVDNENK